MKKTIKRAIEVTTRSRKLDRLKAEFYSHDKNNATIELTLDEITAEQVIALFYFTASKRYYQTNATIEANTIKIAFDTSLITEDEAVICFIYFEKVEQSADVHRFAFDVKMSEIDKTRELPIEEKESRRVVYISDIVTKKEMDALFERLNITGGYDDRPLVERIERLESKPNSTYDDSDLQSRVRFLEAKEDKDTVYDDSRLRNEIAMLNEKTSIPIFRYTNPDNFIDVTTIRGGTDVWQGNSYPAVLMETVSALGHGVFVLTIIAKPSVKFSPYNTYVTINPVDKDSVREEWIHDGVPSNIATLKFSLNPQSDSRRNQNAKKLMDDKGTLSISSKVTNGDSLTIDDIVTVTLTKLPEEIDIEKSLEPYMQRLEADFADYFVSKEDLDQRGYLTSHQDLSEYAKKSEIPKHYDDSVVKQRLTTLESSALTRKDLQPEVMTHQLDELRTQVAQAPKGKLGYNLLANSGNKVTNKQYPTTYLQFLTPPTQGKQYTLTVKVDAPASKTGVVVHIRNNVAIGSLEKKADGIYSTTFTWNARPQTAPFELVVYQPPNNGVEASLVWAKLVEGVNTDYNWYPNYTEISNVYTFAEEASIAIESNANLLDNTLKEKTSSSEFLSYADISPVIDAYGVGKYTLSFDLKAKTAGNMGVYISGTGKYTFLQEVLAVDTEYKRYTLHLDFTEGNASAASAALSFYGGKYGNGVIPSVQKLRLSKGIYRDLPWKPSDKELAAIYEKMMK